MNRTLTRSNGKYYDPVNSYRVAEKKLARAQRKLARMVKRSNNWQKQKRRIQKQHLLTANIRLNHLHQISHEVSKNHTRIVLEDLDVKNMSASAKGTVEKPGENVKQKSGLNKAILDYNESVIRVVAIL